MEPIDFSKIVDWAKLQWEDAVSYCQTNYQDFPQDYLESAGLKAKKYFECSFIMDSGTIRGEVSASADPRENCKLECVLSHSVGSQDSSANIETYAQTITMTMRSPERFRGYVTRIFERFSANLKSVSATIDGKTCLIKADELPVFGKKTAMIIQSQPTSEGFNVTFDFVVVAFSGPMLSNSYSIALGIYDKVDGTLLVSGSIPFAQVTYSSTCEMMASVPKEITKTNKQNFRTLVVHVQAVLPDTEISQALLADAEDGTYFGKPYKLTKTGKATASKWLTVQHSSAVYVYGSFVSWEADLIPTK